MKKNIVFIIVLLVGIGLGAVAIAQQDKGSEIVIFEKGMMPHVSFDHHMHQKKLDDECSVCHDLFPMQAGIIKKMISEEKLKKQQVMNEKCVKCHKDRKKEGLAAGPTSCTVCHVRPE